MADVGAIVGARTLYVISYWREQFAANPFPEIFMVQHGGLVFYGGLIGATLAGIIYIRLKQLPMWKVADIMAPSIALGLCVWAHRLPDERLLLWAGMPSTMGHSFSGHA